MKGEIELSRLLTGADPELRAALDAVMPRARLPLVVPPPMRLSQWAEKHFYLSRESSYSEGEWRCYPFQRGILDCIGDDRIEVLDLRKSARVGYTKMVLAGIGYFAEHKRRNQVLYQPTDDDRDEFVVTELDPMMRDVKIMRSIFPGMQSRNKHNTMRLKMFLTGALHLRGGKAAKNYRRLTSDVVWYDELDGFDRDIENEGSAVKLGDKRLEGSTFPKSVRGTTPKEHGFSNITDCEVTADLRLTFRIRCRHCGERHELLAGRMDPQTGAKATHGFTWVDDDPDTVMHVCPHCAAGITQAEYFEVWEDGRWMADDGTWLDDECNFRNADGEVVPAPRHLAKSIWTAYSPQAAWSTLVSEFLEASALVEHGDYTTMKTFVNTTLGQTWRGQQAEVSEEEGLRRRAEAEDEPYTLGTVPYGCLVLVAGVDVQDNRFEVVVWGFGRGGEMWVIDYQVIPANPGNESDWRVLDQYLLTRFTHRSGSVLPLQAVAIDTQGHFTHEVYNYVRMRESRRVNGVRGSNTYGGPIVGPASLQDVNWQGRVLKEGVKVWHVGTDTAKDLLHHRLAVSQPGPGYVHFPVDLPDAFFVQLTAEERRMVATSRGVVSRWMIRQGRKRNEVLDCTVYALFSLSRLGLDRIDAATALRWSQIEAHVQPPRDGGAYVPPPVNTGRRMIHRGSR